MKGAARWRAEAENRVRECDGHRAEHAARAEQLIQLHSPAGPYRCDAGPVPTPSRRDALCAAVRRHSMPTDRSTPLRGRGLPLPTWPTA